MKRLALALGLLLLISSSGFTVPAGSVMKTPFEIINLSLDFTPRAANGITLIAVLAFNNKTNVDNTSSIISTSPPPVVIAGNKVFWQVRGGSIGDVYNVAVRITKNDTGETLEGNILLQIVSGL